MLLVSEQQTFTKLEVSPKQFSEMNDEEAMAYLVKMRGEREKEPRARKSKSTTAPSEPKVRGRKPAEVNLDEAE